MLTEKPREELIAIGAGARAPQLVLQAGYTLGIAADDEEEIEGVLEDDQLLEEVTAARDQVKAAMQDRELMEQEAQEQTRQQDAKLREARVWRRKVTARARRAVRRGKKIPEELLVIGTAKSVADVTAQLTTMTATYATHVTSLGGARAQALLEKGQTLLAELSGADSAQEVARLSKLPKKVLDFYAAKGALLIGLKLINDAGQELYADDAAQAAKFNLKILYRRSGKRGGGKTEETETT
jgi:hypothetical protein